MDFVMLNAVRHLIFASNRTLKLSQRPMGLRPKAQGDGSSHWVGLAS